jgi:hypothetical protein
MIDCGHADMEVIISVGSTHLFPTLCEETAEKKPYHCPMNCSENAGASSTSELLGAFEI